VVYDLFSVLSYLLKLCLPIKVLAAGNEPDFWGFMAFHEVTQGNQHCAAKSSFHLSC